MGINRRPPVAHCRATTHLQTEKHTHTHLSNQQHVQKDIGNPRPRGPLLCRLRRSSACLASGRDRHRCPCPNHCPCNRRIDTAANTTTTTTEEASASQAAAPEATMPQTGFEWMQAYNPYAQFLGGWYPGAGIEAYEAAMNATAAQFAGAGAGGFMPFRIPQMPQWNPQFYTPSFGGWYPGQGFESVVSALTG